MNTFAASVCVVLSQVFITSWAWSADFSPRTKEIIENRCVLCHGVEGEKGSSVYPRIAAQNARYLEKQLRDFREGRRVNDAMSGLTRDLSDADIAELARYFSLQPPTSRPARRPELAAAGKIIYYQGIQSASVPACASCHGDAAHGTAELPRLAGQLPSYIETQIKRFANRERTNDGGSMNAIASGLSEDAIRALAVYLGTLE